MCPKPKLQQASWRSNHPTNPNSYPLGPRERSHIPPVGKLGKSSSKIDFSGDVLVSRRIFAHKFSHILFLFFHPPVSSSSHAIFEIFDIWKHAANKSSKISEKFLTQPTKTNSSPFQIPMKSEGFASNNSFKGGMNPPRFTAAALGPIQDGSRQHLHSPRARAQPTARKTSPLMEDRPRCTYLGSNPVRKAHGFFSASWKGNNKICPFFDKKRSPRAN